MAVLQPALGHAATPADDAALATCAAVGAPTDRLTCYDRLAGRAAEPPVPAGAASSPGVAKTPVPTTSALAATDAPPKPKGADGAGSLLSKYWELDDSDKRGTFNLVGYRPNYALPVRFSDRINRTPHSPTQATVLLPDYQHVEGKFQVSLRSKIAQDLFSTGADAWFAYTQQATWQVWNADNSRPFRSTDYEPEAMLIMPTAARWRGLPFGWQWRYTQLGIAHQSNGQADPLSRSWNRLYAGAGFERGDWSLTARFLQRLGEPIASDNNPDLVGYRGRADFTLNWAHEAQTASLEYRSTLKNRRGSVRATWTYPLLARQPNGVRWYVEAFSGYAETLTEYNFRQTSVGAGFAFLQF